MNETEYKRNNAMVACIIAFILIGGLAIGVSFLLSTPTTIWGGWTQRDAVTQFEFVRTGESIPSEVSLDVDIEVGSVHVLFVDDPDLTYSVSMIVPNETLQSHGSPSVTWSSNTIGIQYPVCAVNITLGVNATYSMSLNVSTAQMTLDLGNGAKIGDIDASSTTGDITLLMAQDVIIEGNVEVILELSTGSITVAIDLPTDVGGHFVGSSTTGSVEVTNLGWNNTGENTYETSNYATATDTLTINASTTTGIIDATLG